MIVLVTGFGPFPGVDDNPTAALARAVDGATAGTARVVGRVLPASYVRAPDETVRLAREVGAALVVGTGVAVRRSVVCVERVAVRYSLGAPDVDGDTAGCGADGPERVAATIGCAHLAQALGADLSDDAGEYVCNAWLYRVVRALDVPVGFVHVPPEGLAPRRLLDALGTLVKPVA